MDWITNPEIWIALSTLTLLEVVLGIDNVIFISILAGKLPREQQAKARNVGLMLAMVMRVLLLLSISAIMKLTNPLFTLPIADLAISGRDLILLVGGLFLMFKSVREIHHKLEGSDESGPATKVATFASVVTQIALLDIVFSLDSVITAVGMVDQIEVMIAAVIIAVIVMLMAAKSISEFVDRHPTVKMLALSFLILIGVALVAEGFHHHIPKGYIYFAMAFSVCVEMLNLRLKKVTDKPVQMHKTYTDF